MQKLESTSTQFHRNINELENNELGADKTLKIIRYRKLSLGSELTPRPFLRQTMNQSDGNQIVKRNKATK